MHLFSKTHGKFTKSDHILHHRESLNKFHRTEITFVKVSEHSRIKLDNNKIMRTLSNDCK